MKRQPSQEDIDIGNRIRKMRSDLNVKAKDLAARLMVTRGAVGNWERGQGIKRENVQKIAAYYSVNANWLLTGRGPMMADREDVARRERLKAAWQKLDIDNLDINKLADIEKTIDAAQKPDQD